jgi:hypothetical protein
MKAQGSGLRAQGTGLRAQGTGLRDEGGGMRLKLLLYYRLPTAYSLLPAANLS